MSSLSTAEAMAAPSNVEVPRPSSSSTAKDLRVPCARMAAVSSSSVSSVLLPSRIVSYEPILVKMRSTGLILQYCALTRQPSWAMMTAMQVCRSTVDLPPMFGPVTTRTPGTPPAFITVSFGTKEERILAAATGWRQLFSSSTLSCSGPWSSTSSARQEAPARPFDALANDSRPSSSARHRTAARNCAWCAWNSLNSLDRKGKRQSSLLSSRMSSSATSSLMRSV
mmetsp:Transcript_70777/g.182520  ORF Transcript_70777/g.182520 Transcript_70777/m.182520 type:complete len:225 (-) Transcript_70777:2493-3167(-)